MRSSNTEWAERINTSIELLKQKETTESVVLALMDRYGISRRQSYRYIEEAVNVRGKLVVPEKKEVFTVKLPVSLIKRVRRYARATGESLSDIVTEVLERFLKRR